MIGCIKSYFTNYYFMTHFLHKSVITNRFSVAIAAKSVLGTAVGTRRRLTQIHIKRLQLVTQRVFDRIKFNICRLISTLYKLNVELNNMLKPSMSVLTLSLPSPLRLYILPYWSNRPFLIFDIRALWRSVQS